MPDVVEIISSIIFGIIGMWAMNTARQNGDIRAFFLGLLLTAFPYFVPNAILSILVGLALTWALFFWKEA